MAKKLKVIVEPRSTDKNDWCVVGGITTDGKVKTFTVQYGEEVELDANMVDNLRKATHLRKVKFRTKDGKSNYRLEEVKRYNVDVVK